MIDPEHKQTHEEFRAAEVENNGTLPLDGVPIYDEAEKRRILRKIDWRVVPSLAVMYLVSFVDRSNIGNARVAHMNDDLRLSGTQYNIALTIFFVPYVLFEIPSNIVLKLIRPRIWLPSIMLAWGVVKTLMGLVESYPGLVVARLLLGFTESGFFTGATFLLTTWYCRYEVQTRMVIFFAGAWLSGAFSGLLAYGIQHMDGISNLRGWKWIFILEGLVTVAIAVVLYFTLPDGPSTATFLNEDERRFVIRRLQNETGTDQGTVATHDKMSLANVVNGLRDWRVYPAMLIYMGCTVGIYTFTMPSTIKELGYSAAHAVYIPRFMDQLLTIPVYVCAMLCTIVVAIASDRFKQQPNFILGSLILAALGYIALIAIPRPGLPGLTYGFLFMAASGVYAAIVPTICWIGNNLAGSSKRAVGMAALIAGGNSGGFIGSKVFLAKEAPKYWTGYGVILGMVILAIVSTLTLQRGYHRDNVARDPMSREEIRVKYTEEQLIQLRNRSPYFRYTL